MSHEKSGRGSAYGSAANDSPAEFEPYTIRQQTYIPDTTTRHRAGRSADECWVCIAIGAYAATLLNGESISRTGILNAFAKSESSRRTAPGLDFRLVCEVMRDKKFQPGLSWLSTELSLAFKRMRANSPCKRRCLLSLDPEQWLLCWRSAEDGCL